MVCKTAWTPKRLIGHLKSHGLIPTTQQTEELRTTLILNDVNETSDVTPPVAGGPPIEGLEIIENGHCCLYCSYCCPTFTRFEKHWSQKHRDNRISAQNAFTLSSIQTFFRPTPQQWFKVNPALTSLTLDDPFAIYLQKQVPQFASSKLIVSAIHTREIPPLLQVTGWHLHLQEYTADKDKIDGLRTLMALPSLRNSSTLFVSLKQSVFQYMVIVRDNARQSAIGIKRLLMECPR